MGAVQAVPGMVDLKKQGTQRQWGGDELGGLNWDSEVMEECRILN